MPEYDPENPFGDIISDELYRESIHVEKFLAEVFHITDEEHEESKRWMQGLITGPMPDSMARVIAGPILNDEFLELCRKYEMRSTQFRKDVLDKLYASAIGHLS
jgi:hypothetical protein